MAIGHPDRGIGDGDRSRFFKARILVVFILIVGSFGLLVGRLAWLQLARYDYYAGQADDNRVSLVPIIPNRGLIFDRNGEVIAKNYASYTLEINPDLQQDLDQTLEALGQYVTLTPQHRSSFLQRLSTRKHSESVPVRHRLSDQEVARFTANRFRFKGVNIQARLFRQYPRGSVGAHFLGHMGRINADDQQRLHQEGQTSNYFGSNLIGKMGLEAAYEWVLHGVTGFEEVEVDVNGREIRTISRTNPTPGSNLHTSIDIRLQQYAESLFRDKRGALVALKPQTGEILALVSVPVFNPNAFVAGIDVESWQSYISDSRNVMLNRAILGTYPPGSTYKPFMALLALESGVRSVHQSIEDSGFFLFGDHKFRDSAPDGHGKVDLVRSLVISCDTYYYMLAQDLDIDFIFGFMRNFGFGGKTGIDIGPEAAGILPSSRWKRKKYQQKWYPGETISVGIGQGYNSFTPIQLAYATAMLANQGVGVQPRIVQAIEDSVTGERRVFSAKIQHQNHFQKSYLKILKQAMQGVIQQGTARMAFQGVSYEVAGKTGTSQVIGIKQDETYDEEKIDALHRDHALFTAYAPVENPQIALAVLVENGGFGGQVAAPIARKVLDFFFSQEDLHK